jgi:hypothetical protein
MRERRNYSGETARSLRGLDWSWFRQNGVPCPASQHPKGTQVQNSNEVNHNGEEMEMMTPPDYLEGKVLAASGTGPAALLQDGQWRGHGEPEYSIFDVQYEGEDSFFLQLPDFDDDVDMEELTAPVVTALSNTGVTFPIYDPRRHPASLFYPEDGATEYKAAAPQPILHCPNCDRVKFKIAVGFEIPGDSISPNDTSWFALAVQCGSCGWKDIIYDDETA